MVITPTDVNRIRDGMIETVSQQVGLTEEQSRQAILVAFDYLREQLPSNVAGDVGTFLEEGGNLKDAITTFYSLVSKSQSLES